MNEETQRPAATIVAAAPRHEPKPADPCVMVIFGAFGDLTKRLVVPALYNLNRTGILPAHFALIGVDLADGTAESWREHLHTMLESFVGSASAEFEVDKIDEKAWSSLAARMSYVQGDITKPTLYAKLSETIAEAQKKQATGGNVIFYLAVADRFFGAVVGRLGEAKLTRQEEGKDGRPLFWRRVVIEKPFGHDAERRDQAHAA